MNKIRFVFVLILIAYSLYSQAQTAKQYTMRNTTDTLPTGEIQTTKTIYSSCDTCKEWTFIYYSEEDTILWEERKKETKIITEKITFWEDTKQAKEHIIIYHNAGFISYKSFYKSGNIHVSGSYLILSHPEKETKGSNGIYSSTYIREKKDGIWQTYDENGNIIKTEYFDVGENCLINNK